MAQRSGSSFSVMIACTIALAACAGSAGGGGGGGSGGGASGGAVGSGGTGTGTGGATTGTGGATAGSGGAVGSGGAPGGTGGRNGTGGAQTGTGGTAGEGGRAASGGRMGNGGRGTGGAVTGSGGAAGSPSGTGGSPSGAGGGSMSAGCGKTPPASARLTIDVGGTSREYILLVPTGYNPMHAYRLIFTWHPLGGSAMQVAGSGNNGYYGLRTASNGDAILVSPEGLPYNGGTSLGWANTGGGDINFLKAMIAKFKDEMCIDETRMFSTGFSFGGMMSNAVGCAGLARAIAPMAGNSQVSGCASGTQPVAFMGFHGTHDSVVDISGGQKARDVFVKRNGCSTTTAPLTPTWCDGLASNYLPCNCVTYQDCMAGYPVTWCEYNADHQAAPTSAATLWTFFSQF